MKAPGKAGGLNLWAIKGAGPSHSPFEGGCPGDVVPIDLAEPLNETSPAGCAWCPLQRGNCRSCHVQPARRWKTLRKPQNFLLFFFGALPLRNQQSLLRGDSHYPFHIDGNRAIAVEPNGHLLVRLEFNFTFSIKSNHTL